MKKKNKREEDDTISIDDISSLYKEVTTAEGDWERENRAMSRAADMDNEYIQNIIKNHKIEYDRLLNIANQMYTWIFTHTADHVTAYKECGLTDEEIYVIGSL